MTKISRLHSHVEAARADGYRWITPAGETASESEYDRESKQEEAGIR